MSAPAPLLGKPEAACTGSTPRGCRRRSRSARERFWETWPLSREAYAGPKKGLLPKMPSANRSDGRGALDLRPVRIERGYMKFAEGSCLICMGDTRIICTATVEDRVPMWMKGRGEGWVTAEYAMIPRS